MSFSIKTQIQIDGYRLLKQKESRIIQSVEDVTPQIGFAIKTNDYAYTYVVYIGVTHGTDNIEIDMITKNDVIIAMNGNSRWCIIHTNNIKSFSDSGTNTHEYDGRGVYYIQNTQARERFHVYTRVYF